MANTAMNHLIQGYVGYNKTQSKSIIMSVNAFVVSEPVPDFYQG